VFVRRVVLSDGSVALPGVELTERAAATLSAACAAATVAALLAHVIAVAPPAPAFFAYRLLLLLQH